MDIHGAGPIREVAANMGTLLARNPLDPTENRADLVAALQPLVGHHEELFAAAYQRPTKLKRSRVAYFDPALTIVVSAFGPEFREPIHNHGLWNVLLICRGSMEFREYRRDDDGSKEGYAEVSLVEDRIVRAREVGAVGAPPNDIHALNVAEEETWMVTVTPGDASRTRQIYDLETNSYTLQTLNDANDEHQAMGR